MNTEDLKKERERALDNRLAHEFVKVTIYKADKIFMQYNIDNRSIKKAVKMLIDSGHDSWSLTNTLTGATLWISDFENNMEESCKMMGIIPL